MKDKIFTNFEIPEFSLHYTQRKYFNNKKLNFEDMGLFSFLLEEYNLVTLSFGLAVKASELVTAVDTEEDILRMMKKLKKHKYINFKIIKEEK